MKRQKPLKINILTIFPEILDAYFSQSILKRAREKGLFEPYLINIRDFSNDRHHTVDDKPYGGGSGMVMKIEPIARAILKLRREKESGKIYLLSPSGRVFNHQFAIELLKENKFTLVCGRYEGMDDRIETHLCDDVISIGDYVLTGGELAAGVISDAVVRLIPKVLGADDSAQNDSFYDGLLDYPHYTRPPIYKKWKVPEILLSGDHERIAVWRREQQLSQTFARRPDLLKKIKLNISDTKILDNYIQNWQKRKLRRKK